MGCSDAGTPETTARDPAVYAAVIDAVVAGQTPTGTPFDKVVYVAGTATNRIGLEVQAAVVAELNQITVRFVDDRSEAIDAAAPGDPVLHGGLLLTLGPIDAQAVDRVTVDVGSYRGAGTDSQAIVVVERHGGKWVVGSITPGGS